MPTDQPSQVRTRFAPSPTGYLHVGGVRTALFNWLYARHHGGVFVLRIEDTDAARNTPEAMAAIIEGLGWLGLDWDEGPGIGGPHAPYFQSERTEIYQRYLQRLLDTDRAYEDDGAIRFRVPDHEITLDDTICGSQTINLTVQGASGYDAASKQNVARNPDMVVRKPDGAFIFHFVNVVDDIEMGITHVIRGEDHLSNTPRHLALYEAFDAKPPIFAHIPLILNEDGSKMSKRDTGASLNSYIDGGFLPGAVNNFLCLLGWSPKDDSEILPIDEITRRFSLEAVNRGNAKFDLKKCLWLNSQYLLAAPLDDLRERATPILEAAGLATREHQLIEASIGLVREKIQKLDELPDWIWYFFQDDIEIKPEALEKVRKNADAARLLGALSSKLETLEQWEASELEATLTATVEQEKVKLGALMMPTRAAISGQLNGPGVYDIMELLGRDKTLRRLGAAAQNL
jgi:glutamyl-tRNA synthetase